MQHQRAVPGSGLGLALTGFIMLSCGDAVIKSMGGEWPGTAVAALRFSIGAALLSGLLLWREGVKGLRIARPGLQFARGAALAFSSLTFFLALFQMPIAEATTIGFVSPMLAALFSLMLLGERPAPAIWPAIALGLAGVMLVLRPNFSEMGWAAVLPLAAAAGFSLMLVLNRMAAGSGTVLQMQFATSAVAAAILIVVAAIGHASGLAAFTVTPPGWDVIARCALIGVTASASHALIYIGDRARFGRDDRADGLCPATHGDGAGRVFLRRAARCRRARRRRPGDRGRALPLVEKRNAVIPPSPDRSYSLR